MTDRLTRPPPHTATAGHLVPAGSRTDTWARLIGLLERVWGRLGVTDGPFDCDFVVALDGTISLIELSPRLGGNSLSTLIRAAYDFDLVAYAVRHACGDPAGAPASPTRPRPLS